MLMLDGVRDCGNARHNSHATVTQSNSDDVFRQTVGEVLLFRAAGHVDEGQHGNRWFAGHRRSRFSGIVRTSSSRYVVLRERCDKA
jgi:hypothetical protein